MPDPPYPSIPAPVTWSKGQLLSAPLLRSDVVNALLLLTQPPVFTGTQTGVPVAFTVAGGTFSAPGTAYRRTQPLVFSASGGGFPPGLTAGQVYYAADPDGTTFGVSTTPGGSTITGTGSGSGIVATTQLITQNAWTGINLDTEPGAGDAWNGHQTTLDAPSYYGMLPGIYLAEFTFPASVVSSVAAFSAGLFTQEGSNPLATIGGQCGRLSATAGFYASVTMAKLVQFTDTGNYGTPGNNYVAAAAWTDSAAAITPLAAATRQPQMNVEWLAAPSGNPLLPVPDNDAWPVPPSPARATFVNKNIRDTISFLAYRPVMEAVYNAGTFSLSSQASLPAGGTKIPLDTPYIDNWGAFSASTSTWTAPIPGVYDVYGQVPTLAASTSAVCAAGLMVTSANYNGGSQFAIWGPPQSALTSSGEVNCAAARPRRLRLNAGDTVKLGGFQNDTGSNHATVPSGTWQARLITIWRGK